MTKGQADSTAKNSKVTCGDGETGLHVIEAHGLTEKGSDRKIALPQLPKYSEKDAPCICTECPQDGIGQYEGDHGFMHALGGKLVQAAIERAGPAQKDYAWTYKEAKAAGIRAFQQTLERSGWSRNFLEEQIDTYRKFAGVTEKLPLRTESLNLTDTQKELAHELVPSVTLFKW